MRSWWISKDRVHMHNTLKLLDLIPIYKAIYPTIAEYTLVGFCLFCQKSTIGARVRLLKDHTQRDF